MMIVVFVHHHLIVIIGITIVIVSLLLLRQGGFRISPQQKLVGAGSGLAVCTAPSAGSQIPLLSTLLPSPRNFPPPDYCLPDMNEVKATEWQVCLNSQ